MKAWWMVMGVLGFLLTGCSSSLPPGEAPQAGTEFSSDAYKIGVGDQLEISVWRDAELSRQVTVLSDGKISIPLVGETLAAGKTTDQLAKELTDKLTSFVRNPQVTVIVANPVSTDFQQRVRVTGAITQATSVPFRKGMTVLDLVLMAGGPNVYADPNATRLYRHTAEGVKVYPVRLDDILKKGELETNYPLLPSDIVTVPERLF